MKLKAVLSLVGLLALISVAGALVYFQRGGRDLAAKNSSAGGKVAGVSAKTGQPAAKDVVEREIGDPFPYDLDAVYPEIHGTGRGQTEALLNAAIADLVETEIAAFRKDSPVKSSFTVRYQVEYLSKNFASIVFNFSDYSAGAAHPNNYIQTLNYDLAGRRKLSLGDLFRPDSKYLDEISALAIADLRGQLGDDANSPDDLVAAGAAPKPENYGSFGLGPEGLTVYFDPYQVASYAAGVRQVTIPFAKLPDFVAGSVHF